VKQGGGLHRKSDGARRVTGAALSEAVWLGVEALVSELDPAAAADVLAVGLRSAGTATAGTTTDTLDLGNAHVSFSFAAHPREP